MNKPRICAVIVNTDLKAVKEIEPLADLFEVRIDIIGEGWQGLVKKLKRPWIATNRTVDEGGKWQGTEARRIEALLQAIALGAEMVDIEFKTKNLENIVPLVKKRVKCILSFHDLEKTPHYDELKGIVQKQIKAGADICKVVTTARQFEDNLAVLRLVSEFSGNKVVSFAMGQEGQLSRVLSPLAGADFTYAAIEVGKESAPGQITVKEMTQIYGMMKGIT
ncbi:MAG: type I 3-dehydroquinate dehydratase [Chloroflexi bacterium RBG_16_51_9]|nr:MAG: type I 3-dehydroquinate dehydratase [Chloroflexi bacterium RBG_16_51_9]